MVGESRASFEGERVAEATDQKRRWERGPDPTAEECPKGNKTTAALWRARKAIIEAEERATAIRDEITARIKAERSAYEGWMRRERVEGEHAAVKAMRQVGVDSAGIGRLGELAKAKGMTVEEYLAQLAEGARNEAPDVPSTRGRP